MFVCLFVNSINVEVLFDLDNYDHLHHHDHHHEHDLHPHRDHDQVRCLRRWLREMEARIDPLQVTTLDQHQ